MSNRLKSIGDWLDERLKLRSLYASTAGHMIPRSASSWWYALGSATMLCLVIQIITGLCLSIVYQPSAEMAYTSIEFLNYEHAFGWFLRALHYWGSNFMVALLTLHAIQVFLMGAYKYPRELTWLVGCTLLLLTLGAAFTGQIMRFDQDAYWGLGIGVSIMGRIPFIGPEIVALVLGGPIISGETLSRFFVAHVFLVPGLLIALLVVHLRLVLTRGISEYPVIGEHVDPETYDEEYQEKTHGESGIRFFPEGADKDLFFAAVVLFSILFCSAVFGPKGPVGPPDPTLINAAPRPDFYFLSLFAVLALMPPAIENFFILGVLPLLVGLLFLAPFISNRGARHPSERPAAVMFVVLTATTIITFAYLGVKTPWSPAMDAWSGEPVPAATVAELGPLELAGAAVFQAKQCRNCHALSGSGGERGPDLSDVASRLTGDQLTRQVLQGGGNMPAYGKQLSPQQTTALVAFMRTLYPAGELPAREATIPVRNP